MENKLRKIYESYINGQGRQMVKQIEEYGLYDVWSHLNVVYSEHEVMDMVIKYHFIKYR